MTSIARVFINTGQLLRAESLLRETLKMGEKVLAKDSWILADIKGALGECLMAQKRYAEAETLLIESNEVFKVSQVEQSFRIKEARDRLAVLREERRGGLH
jgi:lipopolysaccharide biosynthesis regulator YciM